MAEKNLKKKTMKLKKKFLSKRGNQPSHGYVNRVMNKKYN